MKRLKITVALAAAWTLAACQTPARQQAVEPCPVLKVNVTNVPTDFRLPLHPSLETHSRGGTVGDYLGEIGPEYGIDIAVLWRNNSAQTLRDVTVRLDYQQSRSGVRRFIEQQFAQIKPGGHWTMFKLRGSEFEDTGHVAAWHVSVLSAGQVMGKKDSMLWTER